MSSFRNVSRATRTLLLSLRYSTISRKTGWKGKGETSLYKRITPLGNPNESIEPVLDQWLQEGRSVNDAKLRFAIRQLRHYRRFNHALQLSKWMSEKRFIPITPEDVAIRLGLIAKIHGVEAAENYFNTTSTKLRTLEVHVALLNGFSHAKHVDKAEDLMQKMKEIGVASCSKSYNALLNLYFRTGNREKLETVLLEMEAKGIKFDSYTYSILLSVYGTDNDIERLTEVLSKMESEPGLDINWMTYAVSAKQYLKAQLVDKALESLKKSERSIGLSKWKNEAYSYIIPFYAAAGKKEEVLRLWQECKTYKITNKDYMSVLPSVLKFDDFEAAEKILKEWEDSDLVKDIRIPNFLMSTYCQNGLVRRAEALLVRIKRGKWQKPDASTWSWMSLAYVKSKTMSKAVETMEFALREIDPRVCWKARGETLAACLKYLKERGETERLNFNLERLKDKERCVFPIPDKIHENLVEYLAGECALEDVFKSASEVDSEVGTQDVEDVFRSESGVDCEEVGTHDVEDVFKSESGVDCEEVGMQETG